MEEWPGQLMVPQALPEGDAVITLDGQQAPT